MHDDLGRLEDLADLGPRPESPEAREEDVERIIRELERRMSRQLNVILHQPRFRALEKAWRELGFLVGEIPANANVQVRLLSAEPSVVKSDLLGASSLSESGLLHQVKAAQNGADASPYSFMILGWEIGRTPEEMELLWRMAALGEAAQLPTLIGITPGFLGAPSFDSVGRVPDLGSRLQGSEYVKWNRLRQEDGSRYLTLCACGFALRYPFIGFPMTADGVLFEEEAWRGGSPATLWGNPAFAMASVLSRGFHGEGVLFTLHGVECGRVEGLPKLSVPQKSQKGLRPLEATLPNTKTLDLAMNGIITLSMPEHGEMPCFLSAITALKPRTYRSRELTVQVMAYSRLQWVFFASRVAQCVLRLRQVAGRSLHTAAEIGSLLSSWVSDNTSADDGSARPFRQCKVEVGAEDEHPGWWLVHIEAVPSVGWEGLDEPLHIDIFLPAAL